MTREYTRARADKHKLSRYTGPEPNWRVLIEWARELGGEHMRHGESPVDAIARVVGLAMDAWMAIPGHNNRLDDETHRLDWIRGDLDKLTLAVRANAKARRELADNISLRAPRGEPRSMPPTLARPGAADRAFYKGVLEKFTSGIPTPAPGASGAPASSPAPSEEEAA